MGLMFYPRKRRMVILCCSIAAVGIMCFIAMAVMYANSEKHNERLADFIVNDLKKDAESLRSGDK